jgi:hypothetical protein
LFSLLAAGGAAIVLKRKREHLNATNFDLRQLLPSWGFQLPAKWPSV